MLSDAVLLANDYDTMCRVNIAKREVMATVLLQGPGGAVRQFIGDYYAYPNGTCAVARPFSGDAVLLDSSSLEVVNRVALDWKPLSICMTSESDVVTRDWGTGRIAIGSFPENMQKP